jgi:hypothetical protein
MQQNNIDIDNLIEFIKLNTHKIYDKDLNIKDIIDYKELIIKIEELKLCNKIN